MKTRLAETAGVCCLVGLVLVTTSVTSGQVPDPVTRAKALYTEAAYDEALVVLKAAEGAEAHQYRALCLLALGRTQEAERALESLVAAAPTYTVSSNDLPPRAVAMFEQTRRRVMPALVKKLFTEARADFQARNLATARDKFEQVLLLTSDPVMASSPEAVDLQLLVGSYIDIVKNSAPSTAAATPSRTASAVPVANISQPRSTLSSELFPPASASVPPVSTSAAGAGSSATARPAPAAPAAVTTSASSREAAVPPAVAAPRRMLVPATTVRQNVPAYTPPDGQALRPMSGAVRVSIGANGKVTSAVMEVSLDPRYDARLLSAAKSWVYKPATLDGQPIESEKIVQINIAP